MMELKCVICGMNINDKNCNINSNAFSNKNSKEQIVYCPFCGVGKAFLEEKAEKLKNTMPLDAITLEVLDKAMKLETFNGDFYLEASKMAKNQAISNMFKDLSKIEYMHARVHKALGEFNTSPTLNKVNYAKYDSDELLLQIAKKREEHAISFYKKYYNSIASKEIRSIFDAFITVEAEHIELTSLK